MLEFVPMAICPFTVSVRKAWLLDYNPYEVVAGGYRILPAFLSPGRKNPIHSASHSMLSAPALFRRKKKNNLFFFY